MQIQSWANSAWIIIGAIVLVSNSRKRTVHDFIAGTVVIKSIYLDKIRETVNSTESEESVAE
jgi:uncharacterized RDD family membrane protein YckC